LALEHFKKFSPFLKGSQRGFHHIAAAHGRAPQDQEKPPWEEHEWALGPEPEPEEPHEKEDRSLHVSAESQEGHTRLSCGSEGNTSSSKVFPHLLQRNS
jgi:hypothetical protein